VEMEFNVLQVDLRNDEIPAYLWIAEQLQILRDYLVNPFTLIPGTGRRRITKVLEVN
jgi:hypothetical protein